MWKFSRTRWRYIRKKRRRTEDRAEVSSSVEIFSVVVPWKQGLYNNFEAFENYQANFFGFMEGPGDNEWTERDSDKEEEPPPRYAALRTS